MPDLILWGKKQVLYVYIKKINFLAGIIVAFITFSIALFISIGSEALIKAMDNYLFAVLLLFGIIFLGIIFDIVGTASTAADLPPFNAKAAKKIFGAKQAVKITRNAAIVANYCNDVIGDIAGTLSGAIGAGIVVSILQYFSHWDVVLTGAVMTSFIAALTVGGKSMGKSIAVNYANNIIFSVAQVLAWWEKITGIELLNK